MKYLHTAIIVILMMQTGIELHAQAIGKANVFAEVVESVSANSNTETFLTFYGNENRSIDFGKIEIKSSVSATCSLLLGTIKLIGNEQKNNSISTLAIFSQTLSDRDINGAQSIWLQYMPNKSAGLKNGSTYQGEIDIVLAYN